MQIMVDFYKPSGKWYAGGKVDIGDVKLWQGRDVLLRVVWKNQNLFHAEVNRECWTIVASSVNEYGNPNRTDFYKAVLQVARDID